MSSSSKSSGSVATKPQATMPTTSNHQNQVQVPHEKIAMRAYAKWQQRGCPVGSDMQDWQEAEAELRAEMTGKSNSMPPAPAAKQQRR